MSGHNEFPTIFEKVLPDMLREILAEIARHSADRRRQNRLEDVEAIKEAEQDFTASMEGLYAYLGRELEFFDKPVADMSQAERDALAERLAGSLKGG